MRRLPDWLSRFERFLSAHRTDRFVYGSWDCCLFVCDAIEVMTGTDPAQAFRGSYAPRAEAMAAVRAYTGTASIRVLARKITAEHGMELVPGLNARRGDLVMFRRPRSWSLGIVALNGFEAMALDAGGIVMKPIAEACFAWRV